MAQVICDYGFGVVEKRSWSVPETCAVRRKDFGRSVHIEWHQPRTLDQLVALRHAEFQHHFAIRVKAMIRGRKTQLEVARECDFGRTRFNEVLNGRAWLGFDDMLRIEQVIGPIFDKMKFKRTELTHPDLIGRYPRNIVREPEPQAGKRHPLVEPQPEPGAAAPRQRA